MKAIKFIKPCLIIIVLLAVMSGCKKDVFTGSLKINFTNHPADLTVVIIPAENPVLPITSNLRPDANGVVSVTLNPGNYIVDCSSTTYFSETGFQIKPGETTTIYYGTNNSGVIH